MKNWIRKCGLPAVLLAIPILATPVMAQSTTGSMQGTVMDEQRFSVLGGEAEAIAARVAEGWTEGLTLAEAVKIASRAISGPNRTLVADDLEVAALARTNGRRCFQRLTDAEVATFLA